MNSRMGKDSGLRCSEINSTRREAKQYFGLEDFMMTEMGVANAANLAFPIILLSAKLLKNSYRKLI